MKTEYTPPMVSVIIPTYNRADYICHAIESVLRQTYTDYEIMVVDDGSTDNTKLILEKYKSSIVYIYQNNKGASAARNKGILASKGKYISFLDSDDLYLPNKLEEQVAYLESHPSVNIVYSWFENIDEKGNELKRHVNRINKNITFYDFLLDDIGIAPHMHSLLFNRKCFDEDNLFDEELKFSEDSDLWLRLAYQGNTFTCLPKILSQYRYHNGSISSSNKLVVEKYIWKMFSKIFKLSQIDKTIKDKIYFRLFYEYSWIYHYEGKKDIARKYLMRAISCNPEVLIKSSTYIQWAYNFIPFDSRSDNEVFKRMNVIQYFILDVLNTLFSNKRTTNFPDSYKKISYTQAHLALATLFYYARQMKEARDHYLHAFKINPKIILSPVHTYTFLKSMLGTAVVEKISTLKAKNA